MATKKMLFQVIMGIFMLSFVVAACNNESKKTESSDSTAMKSDSTMTPAPMDTSKMMSDTTKMDTSKTKPVKEGN